MRPFHAGLALVVVLVWATALVLWTGRSDAPLAPPAARPPLGLPIHRSIRVAVACDEEYRDAARRAGLDWRSDAFDRVREASEVFEREFGIRWEPVRSVTWESDDTSETLQDLRKLLAKLQPEKEDVVLGLVGQSCADGQRRVYAALGNTDYFGRTAMVGVGWDGSLKDRGREPNAIAHEFGHLLGAWHTNERDTIMTAPSRDLSRFDAQAKRVLALTRDFDFVRGLGALGAATEAAIDAVWREGHAPDAEQPVAEAYRTRGWRRFDERDFAGAQEDFIRSIEIWEACAGPDAAGLVSPPGRARVCEEPPFRDPSAELAWALRANRIALATDPPDDAISMSWMVLGRARWANGQDEESVAAYASAYRRRLELLGPGDPKTLEARSGLEWWARRGTTSATHALLHEAHAARAASRAAQGAPKKPARADRPEGTAR